MPHARNPVAPQCPEKNYLMKVHGLTREDWFDLLRASNSACAICRVEGRRLYTDHHHDLGDAGLRRGSVRGLLCWV